MKLIRQRVTNYWHVLTPITGIVGKTDDRVLLSIPKRINGDGGIILQFTRHHIEQIYKRILTVQHFNKSPFTLDNKLYIKSENLSSILFYQNGFPIRNLPTPKNGEKFFPATLEWRLMCFIKKYEGGRKFVISIKAINILTTTFLPIYQHGNPLQVSNLWLGIIYILSNDLVSAIYLFHQPISSNCKPQIIPLPHPSNCNPLLISYSPIPSKL